MQVFHRTTKIGDEVTYEEFVRHFGRAAADGDGAPFLLVRRGDGQRLEVVVSEGRIMLCHAPNSALARVSFEQSYMEGQKSFPGLREQCVTNVKYFIGPSFAMEAVKAFYRGRRMSEHVDFHAGLPDPDILTFPEPLGDVEPAKRNRAERTIEVPESLRADIQEVCEYLEHAAEDPDEFVDFDEAIQIGRLCGGRVDENSDQYLFSYYCGNGDTWEFEVSRTMLEALGDGGVHKLTVVAWEAVNRDTKERSG